MSYRVHILAVGAAVLSACSGAADNGTTSARTEDLYGRSSVFWPTTPGRTTVLSVCWKNPGRPFQYPAGMPPAVDAFETTTEVEGWVRSAVEETWQRHLNVDFVGWEACRGGEDISIAIGDMNTRDHSSLGRESRGGELALNLTSGAVWRSYHQHYDPTMATAAAGRDFFFVAEACVGFSSTYDAAHPEVVAMTTAAYHDYWRTCVSGTAVHELGHALGFLHEQYRRDTGFIEQEVQCYLIARQIFGDDVTDIPAYTRPGDVGLGPFDARSIMSYCRADWSTYEPTPEDFAAAALVYGAR